jgi:hypothetical protein
MQDYTYLLVDGYNTTISKTSRGYRAQVPELNLELCAENFEDIERLVKGVQATLRSGRLLPVIQV